MASHYTIILNNPTIRLTALKKNRATAISAAAPRPRRLTITQYLTQAQPAEPPTTAATTTSVSQKVRALTGEFSSLTEPIDRVKRLLHYAGDLPPFDESRRTEENRVHGCTAQVWLEVEMDDSDGSMRFSLDSDSEITKGFCSRLIWLFDGAAADQVLAVSGEDLAEMNVVRFSGGGRSRVNAWNSVLEAMQRRTEALLLEQKRRRNGVVI